jgi:phosphonate transport system substrate-binding protein
MRLHLFGALLAVCTLFFNWTGSFCADESRQEVRLAVLPCNNIEITFKKFYPLLQYLEKETGFSVRLVVPSDFQDFAGSVRSGQIGFALQDPHTYAALSSHFDKTSLLRTLTLERRDMQSGVVVVRRDSGLSRLEDLAGKTVLFGPKASTPKWVAARMLFADHGIDIDRDLKSYRNGGCCEDIAFSVYLRSVDAGVICEHFLSEHEEKQKDLGVDARELKVIARTRSFPTRVFAADVATPQRIVASFNQALLKLDLKNPNHARILYRGEIGGFRPARYEDYAALQKHVDEVGLR